VKNAWSTAPGLRVPDCLAPDGSSAQPIVRATRKQYQDDGLVSGERCLYKLALYAGQLQRLDVVALAYSAVAEQPNLVTRYDDRDVSRLGRGDGLCEAGRVLTLYLAALRELRRGQLRTVELGG